MKPETLGRAPKRPLEDESGKLVGCRAGVLPRPRAGKRLNMPLFLGSPGSEELLQRPYVDIHVVAVSCLFTSPSGAKGD